MLELRRDSQLEKAKAALREVASYADRIVQDEKLRADLRAAVMHGTEAGNRIKRDVEAGGISTRLAHDRKLRKKLRAMLDDLESAGERMRRKKSRRMRNALLAVAGAAAALAVFPGVRRRLGELLGADEGSTVEPVT